MPASSAAALKVAQVSVTGRAGTSPGSTREEPAGIVTASPKVSLPVKPASTAAAAALKVLWPETYSGKAGVTTVEAWYGCHWSPGIGRVPRPGPAQAAIV